MTSSTRPRTFRPINLALALFTILTVLTVAFTGCRGSDAKDQPTSERLDAGPIRMGLWRATATTPGGDIEFSFELAGTPAAPTGTLINGDERIPIHTVSMAGDSLALNFPAFNSTITVHDNAGVLEGTLRLVKRGGVLQDIPLRAEYAQGYTIRLPDAVPEIDVSGRWSVTFVEDEGGSYEAIGEFRQDGTSLSGTFLTTTGDYRYLNGRVTGHTLTLSCFDGAHAYLFKATVHGDGDLSGDFWSGTKWHETWTGARDEAAALPNPDSLTALKPGYDRVAFTFPDPDGNPVSLSDERFRGKVVIVAIGGSWCPNCHDEAAFLARFYDEHRAQGLEMVGLMYEHYRDFERAARQVSRFRERDDIQFPLLVAGYSDKTEAGATLPMLTGIRAFPTMIVLDRTGAVRRIHTGFSGPGTGEHYTAFKEEFTGFIESLLAE